MVISKVFPVLTRARATLQLVSSSTRILAHSNHSQLRVKLSSGSIRCFGVKEMATSKGAADANDPKRHLDFKQLISEKDVKGVVVIDVREQSEIDETGKIPGSIHIPLGDLIKALGEMTEEEFKKKYSADKPNKDTKVIFSCRSGARSLKALQTALELGYTKAANYKGGWLDWAEKQGKSK